LESNLSPGHDAKLQPMVGCSMELRSFGETEIPFLHHYSQAQFDPKRHRRLTAPYPGCWWNSLWWSCNWRVLDLGRE